MNDYAQVVSEELVTAIEHAKKLAQQSQASAIRAEANARRETDPAKIALFHQEEIRYKSLALSYLREQARLEALLAERKGQ